MNREKLFKTIVISLKKHGAKRIDVFGSYVRQEERKRSDVDVLVKFKNQKSLLELVGIELELSEATGRKIDLLTEKSISPLILERVKNEMVTLYK